jgi:hypothetical protein
MDGNLHIYVYYYSGQVGKDEMSGSSNGHGRNEKCYAGKEFKKQITWEDTI